MSKEHDPVEHHQIEEQRDPQAYAFMFVAGGLMVAEILFGLLNTFHVINI